MIFTDKLFQEPIKGGELGGAGMCGAMLAMRIGAGAEIAHKANAQIIIIAVRVAAGGIFRPARLNCSISQNDIMIANMIDAATGILIAKAAAGMGTI